MSSSYPLLRPIDICDQCDGLFELVNITPTIRSLRLVKRWDGARFKRLHPDCVAQWEINQKSLDI